MAAARSPMTVGCALALAHWALAGAALAETQDPGDWLNRMGIAVQSASYEGTVLRIQDGRTESLKVVHTVRDGVVREKVVEQEGDGLEIIRSGNEVHCILPDRKSVLVEEWNDQSTLFSTLPTSEIRFGNEYDVAIENGERVAGRHTVLVAIRPHDIYRYGHRLWLDAETGFPLQTKLINENGEAIEQVRFADIRLDAVIDDSKLAPSYSTEDFRWFTQKSGHGAQTIESPWSSDEIPHGFRAVAQHGETLPGSDEVVTHILYSDGLASVSVFIATHKEGAAEGPARVGGSNSFSVVTDGHHVTAVGEVPAATVEQIATTMRRN